MSDKKKDDRKMSKDPLSTSIHIIFTIPLLIKRMCENKVFKHNFSSCNSDTT